MLLFARSPGRPFSHLLSGKAESGASRLNGAIDTA
jgi:hypothetical protein